MLRKGLSRPYVALALAVVALVVSAAVIVPLTFGGTTLTVTKSTTMTTTTTSTVTSVITSTILGGGPIPGASLETADIRINGAIAIAVNANASRLYVLSQSSGSLVVLDASSFSVLANVSLPGNPGLGGYGGTAIVNAGLAIDYSTGMVYASVQRVGATALRNVVELNGSTNSLVGVLPFSLENLAFDSRSHVLWGTQMREFGPPGNLIGVDVRTDSLVANLSVGFTPDGIAVDPNNHLVYSAGCFAAFCSVSEAAIVNGTDGTLVKTVTNLPSEYPSTLTLNPATDILYVSGSRILVALNGTNGNEIFQADPQTCGPFPSMGIDPSSNRVIMVSQNYDYLLVYDGTSGVLVNMYSFPDTLGVVAFNPSTDEIYVTDSGGLTALRSPASTGNVNGTLIGAYQYRNCFVVLGTSPPPF
jgi:YVTN family beta-propeller protein